MWWFRLSAHNDFVALTACYSADEKHIFSGHNYIVDDAQAAQIFHAFPREARDKHPDYDKTASALLQTFLRLFLREIKAGRYYNRGADNPPISASGIDSPIALARQYIEKNLNRQLTIEAVARTVL